MVSAPSNYREENDLSSGNSDKRKRSSVWRFFAKCDTRVEFSIRQICGESVKHGSNTTNMLAVSR